MRYLILILAAGGSRRFGSQKLLVPVKGIPMIQRVLNLVKPFGDAAIVLRPGYEREFSKVDLSGVTKLLNPKWESGISSSIKVGVRYAEDEGYDAVIIVLGDMPFLKAETLSTILQRAVRSRALFVYPTYKGIKGFPTVVKRELFDRVNLLKGDEGFKRLIFSYPELCESVEVDDPGCVLDVDRPEDLKV